MSCDVAMLCSVGIRSGTPHKCPYALRERRASQIRVDSTIIQTAPPKPLIPPYVAKLCSNGASVPEKGTHILICALHLPQHFDTRQIIILKHF